MPRNLKKVFAENRRAGKSTGLRTAYWPGHYFGMPAFEVEAENLAGQVFDAGD